MKTSIALLILALAFQNSNSQKIVEMNFKPHFDKYSVTGCFVLFNQIDNEFISYNPALCDSGFIPASTFKIPHSVIVLEERIIKDTCQIIKWDGHEWPDKSWNHDQTLKTAVKNSCVWVYSGFAGQIGIGKYYEYIRSFDYGNKDLTGSPTRFWLQGLLRISANEQIDFLRKFYNYKLPSSRQSIDMVKDIIVIEQTEKYRLSGKTGGGKLNDSDYIMWLVGYLEKNNKPYFYAMNFISNDFERTSSARYDIVKGILSQLKLIE